jgi:hypothetical protein
MGNEECSWITPSPTELTMDRREDDQLNRSCLLRLNAKSPVESGIPLGDDAAQMLSVSGAARSIELFPICPEECNEVYTWLPNLYIGRMRFARVKSHGFSSVNLRFRGLNFRAVLPRDGFAAGLAYLAPRGVVIRRDEGDSTQLPVCRSSDRSPEIWGECTRLNE